MAIFPIGAQVGADTSSFIGAMGGATRGLSAFTGAAGLGAVAIGVFAGAAGLGLAISAAREFQTEMIKLNTLVGIQMEQVHAWEESIKDLAKETGQAPTDLARAMFAITSGGARGQEALDLLEQSAKASAIGLGDMTAIGRTATAMLQAFGSRGLTAEKAIDVLTSTVREGNLEASSLAGAFSRVLGPAAALGSSVEDIGGFMATFTRLGGSTEQAATGLLNVFNLLIKPPKDAREAMEEMGISIDEVRRVIREKGLLAGLALMNEELEGNVDALGRVIPNTRALIGFLNTIGLQADQYAVTQNNVNDSLGLTAEAFETWSDTADAAFKRFSAQAKVSTEAIGDNFLPAIVVLLGALTKLIGLLELSADGWARIFGWANEASVGVMEFLAIAGAVPEDLGPATQSVDEFVEALQGMGELNLRSLQNLATFSIRTLKEQLESGKLTADQREKAIAQLDREEQRLAAVNAVIIEQIVVREALDEALKAEAEEKVAALELTQDEIDGIAQLVDALQGELDGLTMTRAAIIDKELAELRATDTTREAVRLLLEEIAAQNALVDALKETEREKAAAARAEERRLQTLRREREQTAEANRRKAEREDLARLNAEMQEAMRIATQFADTIGDAFFEVIQGTKGVGEAFGSMVTEILKQMARLAIQRGIVEPLIGAFLGQFAPTVPGVGAVSGTSNDFGLPSGLGGGGGSDFFSAPVGGAVNAVAAGGVVVQQTINFAPSLIDQRSGERFIQEHAGTITGLVAEGARNSGQLAGAFRGDQV